MFISGLIDSKTRKPIFVKPGVYRITRQKLEALVDKMFFCSARVASKVFTDPPPWFRFK